MKRNFLRIFISLTLAGFGFLGFGIGRITILYFLRYFKNPQQEFIYSLGLSLSGICIVFLVGWILKNQSPVLITRLLDLRLLFVLLGTVFFGIGVASVVYSVSGFATIFLAH